MMPDKAKNRKPNLIIFNLEVDSNSKVLAASADWIKSFSDLCENVYVFSTHVGEFDLPRNVKVRELGGGNFFKKIRWVTLGFYSFFISMKLKRPKVVFHHMSQYTAIHPGLLFRLLFIRQGLWYAHAQKNLSLVVAEKIVNRTFTSAPGAFPVKSRKLKYLGQGVNTDVFQKVFELNRGKPRMGLISVGRIDSAKNLDQLLVDLDQNTKLEIEFLGRNDNQEYFKKLISIAQTKELNLKILSDKKYIEIPGYLVKRNYYFCGTRLAVDKAVIEAAACGCIIISTNKNVLELTGMAKIYSNLEMKIPEGIQSQINVFEALDPEKIEEIRYEISRLTCEQNNVKNTTNLILNELILN